MYERGVECGRHRLVGWLRDRVRDRPRDRDPEGVHSRRYHGLRRRCCCCCCCCWRHFGRHRPRRWRAWRRRRCRRPMGYHHGHRWHRHGWRRVPLRLYSRRCLRLWQCWAPRWRRRRRRWRRKPVLLLLDLSCSGGDLSLLTGLLLPEPATTSAALCRRRRPLRIVRLNTAMLSNVLALLLEPRFSLHSVSYCLLPRDRAPRHQRLRHDQFRLITRFLEFRPIRAFVSLRVVVLERSAFKRHSFGSREVG